MRVVPRTLVGRVFALYTVTLVAFVVAGLGLFYVFQFTAELEDGQLRAESLVEVISPTISDSAVIGDYDTIRRTLERAVHHSSFSSAALIRSRLVLSWSASSETPMEIVTRINSFWNTKRELSTALGILHPKEGVDLLLKLVATADAVVENYGVGVLEGFGLGAFDVHLDEVHPVQAELHHVVVQRHGLHAVAARAAAEHRGRPLRRTAGHHDLVAAAVRCRLLDRLDLFGIARAVLELRAVPDLPAAGLRRVLRDASGIDAVLGQLDVAIAEVRYRRLCGVAAELEALAAADPDAAALLYDERTVAARESAAAAVVQSAGVAIGGPGAVEAQRWRRYGDGPVTALQRAAATDLARWAMR